MPEVASNPLSLILEKITSGIHPSVPKPSSPFAHFVRTKKSNLAPVIAHRWNEIQNSQVNVDDSTNGTYTNQDHSTPPTAEFCTRIAMEEFGALSDADRDSIRDAVDREHLSALENYNEAIRRIYPAISTHNWSVETVSDLLQPILSGLEAMTGITLVAWGGGLIQGGLGLFNISSSATLGDEPSEHLMVFPKSQADSFEQAALNWMNSVHSNFVYDSRCAALEFAEFEGSRLPKVFNTLQSAHAPRDSQDLANGVEDPHLEPPQPSFAPTSFIGPMDPQGFANGAEDPPLEPPPPLLAPTNSIRPVDPEHLMNGAEDPSPPPASPQSTPILTNSTAPCEDPTPVPIPPDHDEPVNTPALLSTKRRISHNREDADGGGDENQQHSKKMRFDSESSTQSTSQRNVSERSYRVNAATSAASRSEQVLPHVTNRESVPPISTLPQTIAERRHSFPRTTEPPLKKPSGTGKNAHTGRKSLPPSASASTKHPETSAESGETLASLIKKLPPGDKGFLQGLGSITKVDLGPAYTQLLIFLVRLEIKIATHGKSKVKFLDRTFRPNEIKEWINQGRGRNNRVVVIDNVNEFAEQWWAWWTILQPKWRAKDNNGRPVAAIPDKTISEDWRCLRVPGGNGLICVVAGLYWWGRKLEEAKIDTKANKENWNAAVNDCLWVLQRVMSSFDKEGLDSRSGEVVRDEELGDDAMDDEDPQSEGDELDDEDEN
ncbi:hypothetical protein Hypma_005040 [Hypsizygus marmoreus]|uniref:Uncharacterized protein n=1 Tax=Hypsizygus marmoreus TaxID=39966 RepID=A0A369JZ19_HYPMA|nr:hypothetical protein Hypma_005040 [Hypsizygus marmoreus]